MQAFTETFVLLFVAIDLPGILPLFISLTDRLSARERQRLTFQALATAFVLALVILFVGELLFDLFGITISDLRVGGGLILLVLGTYDLLFSDKQRRIPVSGSDAETTIGIVPLGTPLVIGPAAITTILVSQQNFGYFPTLSALLLNLGLVLVAFFFSSRIDEWVGPSVAKAIGKIASLFLVAIAVAMIRTGIVGFIQAYGG